MNSDQQGSDELNLLKEDDDRIPSHFKIQKTFHSDTKPPLDHQNQIYLEINWLNRKQKAKIDSSLS